jgi:hypothetical protein
MECFKPLGRGDALTSVVSRVAVAARHLALRTESRVHENNS